MGLLSEKPRWKIEVEAELEYNTCEKFRWNYTIQL